MGFIENPFFLCSLYNLKTVNIDVNINAKENISIQIKKKTEEIIIIIKRKTLIASMQYYYCNMYPSNERLTTSSQGKFSFTFSLYIMPLLLLPAVIVLCVCVCVLLLRPFCFEGCSKQNEEEITNIILIVCIK